MQARVVPVADRHHEPAGELAAEVAALGVRTDVDASEETIAKRIRSAELEKIPYVIVFGDKEEGGDTLALRIRGEAEVSRLPRVAALEAIRQAATL